MFVILVPARYSTDTLGVVYWKTCCILGQYTTRQVLPVYNVYNLYNLYHVDNVYNVYNLYHVDNIYYIF